MSLWDPRRMVILGLALAQALWAPACAVRPMPEPPSADPSRMSLVASSSDALTLTGSPGAIQPGNFALRVANPRVGDRSQVLVGDSGEFVVVLRGIRTDVLYLEILSAGSDDFLAAVTGGPDTSVTAASPGADQDGDHSPDVIDCAPEDNTLGGSRCGPSTCVSDSDCPVYQRCDQGTCVTDPSACTPVAEVCNNGLDEDCDGVADDGCAAVVTCGADAECAAGEVCVGGVCTACSPEICGNGIDDDCDGQIDDGC